MNFVSVEVSVAAIIPALLLAAYVFFNDKVEREPIGLVALLFIIGSAVYLPVYEIERFVVGIVDKLFAGSMIFGIDGIEGFKTPFAQYAHGFLAVFLGVAVVEELAKWLVMFLLTHKNKNFNCLFDGIVYGTFVSLGFGMMENIRYAWVGGWDLLVIRSLITIPAHLFAGIIMGYCYTMWRTYKTAAIAEQEYAKKGLIRIVRPFTNRKWSVLMLLLPILEHGVYGFVSYFDTDLLNVFFYIFNTVIFIVCLMGIRKIAKKDTYRGKYADKLLDRKYPQIKDICDDVENMPLIIEYGEDDING